MGSVFGNFVGVLFLLNNSNQWGALVADGPCVEHCTKVSMNVLDIVVDVKSFRGGQISKKTFFDGEDVGSVVG